MASNCFIQWDPNPASPLTVDFNTSILNFTHEHRPVCDSPFQLGRELGGLGCGQSQKRAQRGMLTLGHRARAHRCWKMLRHPKGLTASKRKSCSEKGEIRQDRLWRFQGSSSQSGQPTQKLSGAPLGALEENQGWANSRNATCPRRKLTSREEQIITSSREPFKVSYFN